MSALTLERQLIEDEPHVSGDPGNMIFAVRNDTLASLVDTDGDNAPLQVSATGALYVSASISSVSLDSEYAEDSGHTTADVGQFMLAVRNDTKSALAGTDLDYIPFQMNGSGELYVVDEAGNALLTTIDADTGSIDATLTALSIAEDSAAAGGEQGIQTLAVRQDSISSSVSADGDFGSLKINAVGRLYVDSSISSISLDSEYAEDSGHTTGDVGSFSLAVANHTQGALHSADLDYAPLQVDSEGRLRIIGDLDLTGDLTADGAVDDENPLKVSSHSYDQGSAWSSVDSGDKSNLASDTFRRILINDAPNISASSKKITVGTSEAALPNDDVTITTAVPLVGRMRMIVQNQGNKSIFVGPTGVTTLTGIEIGQKASLVIEIGESVDLFAISGTAGQNVRVLEMA